jgi:hypothetical protein
MPPGRADDVATGGRDGAGRAGVDDVAAAAGEHDPHDAGRCEQPARPGGGGAVAATNRRDEGCPRHPAAAPAMRSMAAGRV